MQSPQQHLLLQQPQSHQNHNQQPLFLAEQSAAQRPSVYDLAQHVWLSNMLEEAGASPIPTSGTQHHSTPEKANSINNKDFPEASPSTPHSPPHPSSHPAGKPHHKSHPHDASSATPTDSSHLPSNLLPSLSSHHSSHSHPEHSQQDQHPPGGAPAVESWGMPSPPKAAGDSLSGPPRASTAQPAGSSGAYTHSHNPDPTASPFSPSPSMQQAASSPSAEKSQRLVAESGDSFGSATSATGWNQQQHPSDRDPRFLSAENSHNNSSSSGTGGNSTTRANASLGATLKLPALPGTPRNHSEKALNVMGSSGSSRDLTTPQPRGVLSDDSSLGGRASFSLSLEISKLGSGLGSLPGLGPPSPSGLGGGVTGRNPLLKGMTRLDSSVSLSGTCEMLEPGNGGFEGGGAGGYGHSYCEEGGSSSFGGGGIGKGLGGQLSPSSTSAASQAEQGKQSKYARLFGKLWGGGGKEPSSEPDVGAVEKGVPRQVSVSSRSFGVAAASNLNRAASLSMTQRGGAAVGPPRGKLMNGAASGGLDAMPAREGSYTIKSAGGGEAGGMNGYNKHVGAVSRRGVLDESLIAVGRIHSNTEGASRLYSTSGSMRVPGGVTPGGKKALQAPASNRLLE